MVSPGFKHKKWTTKAQRDNRKKTLLAAIVAIPMILLLAYQAIGDLIHGRTGGENYFWQPVGPGLQLAFLAVLGVVGAVLGWRYLFGKPVAKETEKKRKKYRENRYPHEELPW